MALAVASLFALAIAALALVGAYYLLFPDKAEIIVGHTARAFGWAGRTVRKRAVRGEVQGHLNLGRSSLNSDAPGLLPFRARVQWIDSEDHDSFLDQDEVIVRLSYRDHPHRNLVLAALLYFRRGVLPESTQYLRKPVQTALALLMVDQMLSKARQVDSLNYFRAEILEPALARDATLAQEFDTLSRLHETGYFLRVFIPELIDYPLSTYGHPPRAHHYNELGEFVSYLRQLSELVYIEGFVTDRAGPQGPANLDFFKQRIRISFVIVGRRELLDRIGLDAHIQRTRWCRQEGCRIIYLTGNNPQIVESLAKDVEREGIAQVLEIKDITVLGKYGAITRGFARLEVTPTGGSAQLVADQ